VPSLNGYAYGLSSLTISAWINSGNQIDKQVAGWWWNKQAQLSIGANYANGNRGYFGLHTSYSSSQNEVISNIDLNDSSWHYLVGTYDGFNIDIYIDGILNQSSTWTGTISNTDPFTIGVFL